MANKIEMATISSRGQICIPNDIREDMGLKEVEVRVKGVGSGREPTIRAFMAFDIDITSIHDMTPVPHNGPRPCKPRRV